MTNNASAIEAPRGTRAKELKNAETGGRNDIITIILANGASHEFKERVVLRRFSLAMRLEVGKDQQPSERGRLIRWVRAKGKEMSRNRALRPTDTVFCAQATEFALRLSYVQINGKIIQVAPVTFLRKSKVAVSTMMK